MEAWKACGMFFKSEDSISISFAMWIAPQSVQSKVKIVSWCVFSVNRWFQKSTLHLKTLITQHGHECIFLLKIHCELSPIEMVSSFIYCSFTQLNCIWIVLGVVQVQILWGGQEWVHRSQGGCKEVFGCMSSWGHTTVYKLYLVVHGCLPKRTVWKGSCMGVWKYWWHRGVSNTAYNALEMSVLS